MGKMSELAAELTELRHCGEVLISISETLTDMFSSADAEHKEDSKDAPKAEEKQVSMEEVRAVLAEKSMSGHREAVKALLNKYGADRLSDIEPSKYAALLADAEVTGNA